MDLLDRLSSQVGSRTLAKNILIERGHLNNNGSYTEEGMSRNKMTAEERAIDRHVERYGGSSDDYEYDEETNRCTKI